MSEIELWPGWIGAGSEPSPEELRRLRVSIFVLGADAVVLVLSLVSERADHWRGKADAREIYRRVRATLDREGVERRRALLEAFGDLDLARAAEYALTSGPFLPPKTLWEGQQ